MNIPYQKQCMTDQDIVRRSLIEVLKKNGYKSPDRLIQRDYDRISHEIENGAGILISSSTIKRLLFGDFSRLPQVATLNAIARYLGYGNWHEYLSARQTDESLLTRENDHKPQIEPAIATKPGRFKFIALGTFAGGVIILLSFIQLSDRKKLKGFDKAQFSARKSTTNEIPNTVVFNYNVDEVEADSFFIQQSWDKNRRVEIFKKNYTLTDIYYEPGYHIAKLVANDSVIRTVDVSIPTDRWFLLSKDIIPGSKPEYINPDNIGKGGVLAVREQDLISNQIDSQKEKEYIYTFFPGKIEVSSDHYSLKTRLRVNEVRKNFCPYVMVEIFCQKYFMFFKSTTKGCASESMAQFGENFISGKQRDLTPLGYDVSQWMDLEVVVANRRVKIKLDHKEVFSATYKNTPGLITGLGFISNGLCEIDFVELKGLDGKVVYQNDFNDENP